MGIETQRYVRKPIYVNAVRITAVNFDEMVAWCQGEVLQDEVPGKGTTKKYIKVEVQNPKHPRQTKAFIGDWILKTEKSFKVYTNNAFKASFDLVQVAQKVTGETTTLVVEKEHKTVAQAAEDERAAEVARQEASEKLAEAKRLETPVEVDPKLLEDDIQIEGLVNPQIVAPPPTPAIVPPVENGAPSVHEGKRILTLTEQRGMSHEEIRAMLRRGDVALEQDLRQI